MSNALFSTEAPLRYPDRTRTMSFYGLPYEGARRYEYMDVEGSINVVPSSPL